MGSHPHEVEIRVSLDEQHVALPKLYGAPAYARPPRPTPVLDRPFDPDELPLEVHQTPDEREFASTLPARAYAPGGTDLRRSGRRESRAGGGLHPRAFSLRSIAGRLLGGH
jgi:hypothetical protein